MPNRILREAIIDSEAVNSLSEGAELFFRRLMSVVDDFGRFDARPAVLRSRLYPLKLAEKREADISRHLAECEKAGLIALYAVAGKQYLLFHKLGEPRAKASKYPAPASGSGQTTTNPAARTRMNADANICAQTPTDAPYSLSSAPTDSPTTNTPLPPATGGKESKADASTVMIPADLDTPPFRAAWLEWLADRKARKKTVSARGAAMTLNKLSAFGPAWAVERIEKAIAAGWQGLVFDGDVPGQPATARKPAFQTHDQRLMGTIFAPDEDAPNE